jgi:Cu+-exporting ATPase
MDNATLKLRGMGCASCANSIEEAIRSVPGVNECYVNFGAEQATVIYDPQTTNLEEIQNAVDAAGYSAHPLREQDFLSGDDDAEKATRLTESRALARKLGSLASSAYY